MYCSWLVMEWQCKASTYCTILNCVGAVRLSVSQSVVGWSLVRWSQVENRERAQTYLFTTLFTMCDIDRTINAEYLHA